MSIKKRRGRLLLFAAAALLLLSALPISASAADKANATVDIPVYKQVAGAAPVTDEVYSFSLNSIDGAPMPDGSADGTKIVSITGAGSAAFGPVSYTEVGEYRYTISEVQGNDPRCACDKTVYYANVTVTWKDKAGGEMAAALSLSKGDGIYKEDKALFVNSYTVPASVSINPFVRKTVNGSPASASEFTFRLSANDRDNPMPEGSSEGVKTFSRSGPGQAEAGNISFTEPGEYSYTISEVNGGVSGYTYDSTVYVMAVKVTEENGELRQTTQYSAADGTAASEMDFTNTYKNNSPFPQTGDTTNLILWIVLLAVSAGAATALVIRKKR